MLNINAEKQVERRGRWWGRAPFEFRLEACRLVEGGHLIEDVAKALAMPVRNLRTWLAQHQEGLFDLTEGPADASFEQLEINRLRGELSRTSAERDILKAMLQQSTAVPRVAAA